MRPVPRNIDRPNRLVEFIVSFLFIYYGTMFMFSKPFISLLLGAITVYVIHKITADKPEGAAYRLWYRVASLGHFFPNPKKVRKFEI